MFLPLDATRWTFFESTCEEVSQCAADPTALRVIIGNYHQDANAKSNDFEGFDGDLNGLRINNHLVSPWHFKNDRKIPKENWTRVSKPLSENALCWSDKGQNFETDRSYNNKFDCPCLDGRNSYVTIDSNGIDLQFRDRLQGFVQFSPVGSKWQSYIVAAMFASGQDAYILVRKNRDKFELLIKTPTKPEEIMATCKYIPPLEDNHITLKFGIIKATIGNAKTRQAGILQFTDSYRPHADEIPKGENGHQVELEEEDWRSLKMILEDVPMFVGGIPKHKVTQAMKNVLADKNLIQTYGTGPKDFDLKSMGACIRRININWDDKNRKNERRFLGALDGHGIYRHNEVPFKRDLHLVPGYNLQDRHEARVSTSKINLIVEVRVRRLIPYTVVE